MTNLPHSWSSILAFRSWEKIGFWAQPLFKLIRNNDYFYILIIYKNWQGHIYHNFVQFIQSSLKITFNLNHMTRFYKSRYTCHSKAQSRDLIISRFVSGVIADKMRLHDLAYFNGSLILLNWLTAQAGLKKRHIYLFILSNNPSINYSVCLYNIYILTSLSR